MQTIHSNISIRKPQQPVIITNSTNTDCINVSGAPMFNCWKSTGTWDMPPFRCCPDVAKIEIGDPDTCDDIPNGEVF